MALFLTHIFLIVLLSFPSGVIDIPTDGIMEKLLKNEKLTNILEETKSTGFDMMIHFTPDIVFQRKDYQQFIESVGAKRQLILNDTNK